MQVKAIQYQSIKSRSARTARIEISFFGLQPRFTASRSARTARIEIDNPALPVLRYESRSARTARIEIFWYFFFCEVVIVAVRKDRED